MSDGPWTFDEARDHCSDASKAQAKVEGDLREAYKSYAQAEEAYRKALAVEILNQKAEHGSTVAADLARGDKHVAELRRKRDIADGVREAIQQAAWRRVADRKDAQRFSDWSQRREFAEAGGAAPLDAEPEIIGARRAA